VFSGTWAKGCFKQGERRAALDVALSSCP